MEPNDLSKQAKQNKTHIIQMCWERSVATCFGKSVGSHLLIQLLNNIFTED